MDNSAKLPPELLDKIFEEVETNVERPLARADDDSKPFLPSSPLHPTLFVCRSWHAVAERRLYASISLGAHGTKWEVPDVAAALADTLETNARVAGFVREVRLRTHWGWANNTIAAMCTAYLRILSRCACTVNNLRILEWDSSQDAIGRLKTTIQTMENLQRLSIDLDSPAWGSAALFRSCDEVLQYIVKWPNLTYLTIAAGFVDWIGISQTQGADIVEDAMFPGSEDRSTTLSVKSNETSYRPSPLTELYLYTPLSLNEGHLRALLMLAPNLTGFAYVTTDADLHSSCVALRQAVEAWASTLQHFAILLRVIQGHEKRMWGPLFDDHLCRQLVKMQNLVCMSDMLSSISALSHFPSLKWLHFAPTRPEQISELVEVIPQVRLMKSLAVSLDWLVGDVEDMLVASLRAACTARGVKFTLG